MLGACAGLVLLPMVSDSGSHPPEEQLGMKSSAPLCPCPWARAAFSPLCRNSSLSHLSDQGHGVMLALIRAQDWQGHQTPEQICCCSSSDGR